MKLKTLKNQSQDSVYLAIQYMLCSYKIGTNICTRRMQMYMFGVGVFLTEAETRQILYDLWEESRNNPWTTIHYNSTLDIFKCTAHFDKKQ